MRMTRTEITARSPDQIVYEETMADMTAAATARGRPVPPKSSDEGSVEIEDLVKTYVDDRGRPTFTAVKNISLRIENGEFMVLVGPSGCGKSTTLRMIAGLEKITSGTISIGGKKVNELEPKDRGIAMVFQN